jgi:hypothetical protein
MVNRRFSASRKKLIPDARYFAVLPRRDSSIRQRVKTCSTTHMGARV